MAGQAQVPGGQTTPPNINSLAAQGIQGAGMGTASGMGYTPLSVGATNVTPTNVGVSGLSPTVTAGQLSSTNLDPYMNPYTTSVIDAQQADILRGANIGLDQLGAQAQAAKSFGGSRHGIATSEIGRGVAEMMGQQASGLRQANYQQAQQAAMQDIMNDYNAQIANQQAGQFDIGTNLQGQLANQQTGMQGQLANQSAQLQAQLANQQADITGASHRLGAAGQLGTTNLAPYMNPYTTDVIDASQADVLRGANIGLDQLGAQAQQAKAFGGSRHGIAMSELGRGVGEIMGQQAAGLRHANFAQAQEAARQDQLTNQQADITGASHRLGAAGQLADISNLGFGMGQTVQQNLQTQGAMQQALQQAVMDAAGQKYKEYTGHPAQTLQYMNAALTPGVYSQPNIQTMTKQPGLFDYLTLGASMKAGQPLGGMGF